MVWVTQQFSQIVPKEVLRRKLKQFDWDGVGKSESGESKYKYNDRNVVLSEINWQDGRRKMNLESRTRGLAGQHRTKAKNPVGFILEWYSSVGVGDYSTEMG
jgi:hypothetical protein